MPDAYVASINLDYTKNELNDLLSRETWQSEALDLVCTPIEPLVITSIYQSNHIVKLFLKQTPDSYSFLGLRDTNLHTIPTSMYKSHSSLSPANIQY